MSDGASGRCLSYLVGVKLAKGKLSLLRVFIRVARLENWARAAGFAAILICAWMSTFIWVISNPPFPSDRPQVQQNNTKANHRQNPRDHDETDSDNISPSVQEKSSDKSGADTTRNERERFEKAANERSLTVGTWALAFVTGLLFFTALGQAALFVWQLGLMREGVDDAREAADGAIAGAAATRDVAVAAKTSAETAQKALINLERPWVFVTVGQRLVRFGGIHDSTPAVAFTVLNGGRFPAEIIECHADFVQTDVGPIGIVRDVLHTIISHNEPMKDIRIAATEPFEHEVVPDWAGGGMGLIRPLPRPGYETFFIINMRYKGIGEDIYESEFSWRWDHAIETWSVPRIRRT